jgi:hypothetical protein
MGDAYQRRAQMYLAWMPLWTKEGALFMSPRRFGISITYKTRVDPEVLVRNAGEPLSDSKRTGELFGFSGERTTKDFGPLNRYRQ